MPSLLERHAARHEALQSERDNANPTIANEYNNLWGGTGRKIELLDPNTIELFKDADGKKQPDHMQDEKVLAIMASAEDIGFLQPAIVRLMPDGTKQMLSGRHRREAAIRLHQLLPCEIRRNMPASQGLSGGHIQFISSDDLATMTTTKAVMTVDNSSENSSAATDYSRLPVVSIIPQTTTQTAKSSTAAPTTSTTQRSNNTKSTSTTTAEQSPIATEQIADTTSKQTTYKQPSAATTYHAAVTHSETTTSKNTTAATTTQKTSTSKVTSTTAKTTKKTTHTTTQSTTIFIPVNGIKLSSDFDANNIVLAINQSTTVTAVISPSSATNKNVVWTSNRNDIASVDAAGKITAHSSGKAIITATTQDGNLTASCMVSVS